MPTPLAKYFGTAQDPAGQPLFWPGTPDGFPFRGTMPPAMKQEEWEDSANIVDAKTDILELPRDLDKYTEVIDRAANGWYQIRKEIINYDEKEKVYRVLLQWLEIYGQPPPLRDYLGDHLHGTPATRPFDYQIGP